MARLRHGFLALTGGFLDFSSQRRGGDLYRIVKEPKAIRKQGAYSVVAQTGLILKRGPELSRRSLVLEKKPKLSSPRSSKFAQRDFFDAMARALGQDQAGARARRQDVFVQIAQIDPLPDAARGRFGFGVVEIGEFPEIGSRIAERGLAQPHEARDIPVFELVLVGVEDRPKSRRNRRRKAFPCRRSAGGLGRSTFTPSTMRMSGRSTLTLSPGTTS